MRHNNYNRKTNQVKLCGYLYSSDVLKSLRLSVDYIGFNLFFKSPRYVSLKTALRIIKKSNFENLNQQKKHQTKLVAVLVDPSFKLVKKIIDSKKFSVIQLHGNENLKFIAKIYRYLKSLKSPFFKKIQIWKVFSLENKLDLEEDIRKKLKKYSPACHSFILDVPKQQNYQKGIGEFSQFDLFQKLQKDYNLILAGGIKPENIVNMMTKTKAKIVDVASGVEFRPGVKNFKKVKEIIRLVQ